jgi:hypothetical protein
MDKTAKFWDKKTKNYDKGERGFDPVFKKIVKRTKKHLKSSDFGITIKSCSS